MKKLFVLSATIALVISFNACKKQTINDRTQVAEDKNRTGWKKMVFCLCLYEAAPYAEAIKEEDGSLGGYVQINEKYGTDEDLDQTIDFVEEYLKKVKSAYKSSTKDDLTLMKCIDLYESEELDDFMEELD